MGLMLTVNGELRRRHIKRGAHQKGTAALKILNQVKPRFFLNVNQITTKHLMLEWIGIHLTTTVE